MRHEEVLVPDRSQSGSSTPAHRFETCTQLLCRRPIGRMRVLPCHLPNEFRQVAIGNLLGGHWMAIHGEQECTRPRNSVDRHLNFVSVFVRPTDESNSVLS